MIPTACPGATDFQPHKLLICPNGNLWELKTSGPPKFKDVPPCSKNFKESNDTRD